MTCRSQHSTLWTTKTSSSSWRVRGSLFKKKLYKRPVFERVWAAGHFPEAWREATVAPLPKAGADWSQPAGHRPVWLTSCVSKVVERMVRRRLLVFADGEKPWAPAQGGGRTDRCAAELAAALVEGRRPSLHRVRLTTQLLTGLVSMIPKDGYDGSDVMRLRRITVTSAVYRLWARTRCRHLEPWVTNGPPRDSTEEGKGSPPRTYFGPLAPNSRARDGSDEHAEARYGISIDIAKCFDSLPHPVLFGVARRMGMPAGVLTGLEAMYADMERRFRLPGGVGEPFKATNGVAQGCPLSVILLNGLMAVWLRYTMDIKCGESSAARAAEKLLPARRLTRGMWCTIVWDGAKEAIALSG